ncbi:Alpha/beta hydrolase family protein [Rubripirellula obstinata]|uniref:Alpha/beta hydrolase family protein n=1 Tax=Rubripirellula obstinata TaxID=406547 RepID=A0A5B1CPJ8_9BACT|nr:alpha/beta hydrolase [Rubripirellula obstinata]KAA1261875.1 Alpha/beta hydrolase family protein [Rubripirellula obstinata]
MIQLAPAKNDAILFGQHKNLVGIWTEAADDAVADHSVVDEAKATTAVIMVTAGMIHHSGPFRLHVELANQLRHHGIPSLRFDLSGIGESLGIGSGGSSLDRAADEIGQAIDCIANRYGIEKVILFGLCSGADDSVHTALMDDRVSGVVAMDGCGYRTRQYYWHRFAGHYLPRLVRISKWSSLLRRFSSREDDSPKSLQLGDDIREFPSRDLAQSQLMQLADRSVRMHFIYTSGVGDYYNHAGQFDAMFPSLCEADQITHCYFSDMDHVAFLCEDRAKLVRHISDNVCQMLH